MNESDQCLETMKISKTVTPLNLTEDCPATDAQAIAQKTMWVILDEYSAKGIEAFNLLLNSPEEIVKALNEKNLAYSYSLPANSVAFLESFHAHVVAPYVLDKAIESLRTKVEHEHKMIEDKRKELEQTKMELERENQELRRTLMELQRSNDQDDPAVVPSDIGMTMGADELEKQENIPSDGDFKSFVRAFRSELEELVIQPLNDQDVSAQPSDIGMTMGTDELAEQENIPSDGSFKSFAKSRMEREERKNGGI